jgi:hypothetical protein
LEVEAAEAFDELEEDTQGEGEFGESTAGPLIYAKIVIAIVGVFFFHERVSNIVIVDDYSNFF